MSILPRARRASLFRCWLTLAGSAFLGAGAASAQTAGMPADTNRAEFAIPVEQTPVTTLLPGDTRYRILPLDTIELSFRFTPEFNQTVTIQPDGYVSLLGAGQARLAGLTVPEATAEIVRTYDGVLRDPSVTLVLKDFQRPFFMVLGQVARPGKFELYANTRLQDAIAAAGGFLPGARTSDVLLVRRVATDSVQIELVDVIPAPKHRDPADAVLRPGDAVYVSRSMVGKIDRFLEVSRIGLYLPLPRSW